MMRKRILTAIAIIAGAALAFSLGMWAQRRDHTARVRAAEAFARDLTGLDAPVPAAPPWEEWHYPGAKATGSRQGMDLRMSGKLVRPAGRYAILMTKDEFEKVARFYAGKTQFDDPDAVAGSRSAFSNHGNIQGEFNLVMDDPGDPADPGSSRPVRAKCLIRRSPSYDLTVFITRAEGEAHTHVVLAYDPKTETRQEEKDESR